MAASTASAPARPPGPPPMRGGLTALPHYVRFARDPIAFVGRRFETYGDIYCAETKGVPLYVVRHPDHIAQVLLHGAHKFGKGHTAFSQLSEVLGEGLLTTEGDTWKRQRRMIQPAFTKKRLREYADVMVDATERAAQDWRDGQTLDISREMVELTLTVVTRTLFDHDSGGNADAVADAMRAINETFGRPNLAPRWLPTPGRRRLARALSGLDRHIHQIIETRQPGKNRRDLLQSLIDAVDDEDGGRMTAKELRDQLVTFYLAGHETTSHALGWTWYLLSRNPRARHLLHAELSRVLGGRRPTWDDLANLPYTEYVVLESMRMRPPVPVMARCATVDATIGDYEVAAGSEVVVWIYFTHHDPRWYEDPDRFEPERHAPEAVAERPKLAYLPFGAGPRQCIGNHFSMLESRLILATLAQRFLFEVVGGRDVGQRPGVTLAPKGGVPVVVRTRGN